MKSPFSWDPHSDQPYQLKARDYKKAMRRKEAFSLAATLLSALFILPVALLLHAFVPKRRIATDRFFGMSINLDKDPQTTKTLIDELQPAALLIRFPLWEMERLEEYAAFVRTYSDKRILLNVMQDREHVEDLTLLKKDLERLFETFSGTVASFQIGSTINRAKWGFFSVREYLRFYRVAFRLKQEKFPALKLLGPSVIDFEYHFSAHALFNFFKLRYDALSALLYVDRRGAPENGQMGFDLLRKIDLLDALALLSPKTPRSIYITETNWPISNTAPYAPTSEYECVDEESYADFMVRYYLLAFASQKVDAVYWHQLIAPGYGLVDNRDGIRKRSAFTAFKTMLSLLAGIRFVSFERKEGLYRLRAENDGRRVEVLWAPGLRTISYNTPQEYLDRDGGVHLESTIEVGPSPIYFITKSS